MPPKSTSSPKGKDKNPESQEGDIHTINPNVLLYLQAATRAFPKVESSLFKYSDQCDMNSNVTAEKLEIKSSHVDEYVQNFTRERQGLEGEIKGLDRYLSDVKQRIEVSKAKFELSKEEEDRLGEEGIELMRREIRALESDKDACDDWIQEAQRRKGELRSLQSQIANTEKKYAAEIQELRDRADGEKRKLRDSLVRKLRRARDQLTSTTDDDSAAPTSRSGNSSEESLLLGFGNSTAPSAKQNEKLSREVTMYERDCEQIKQQNRTLIKDETELQVGLRNERTANEALVMKNASHFKAKKILSHQLQDVQAQFVGAMDHHHAQHEDRMRALRETVSSQDTLIDDLQRELELAFNEYDQLNRKLQLRAAEQSKQGEEEKLAFQFLRTCHGAQSENQHVVAQLSGYLA